MSEYQYYEFRALDRRLTQTEMSELRQLSTRATITPTSFVNVYNYGDFRGDPHILMERYFDAFLYIANWGTRELMFRLPEGVLAHELVGRYVVEGHLDARSRSGNLILDFQSEVEPEWVEGGEGLLDQLLPLRDDLQNGDLRALYIGWLAYAARGAAIYSEDEFEEDEEFEEETERDDDEIEPPVPPGLQALSPPLKSLAAFLSVDDDLLVVAAERSIAAPSGASQAPSLRDWIRDLPGNDKNDLLARMAEGDSTGARSALLARFRKETAIPGELPAGLAAGERSVAELCGSADRRAEERRRAEAERKAKEQARRDRERAAKRKAYLDDLATRQEEIWRLVERLIEMRRPGEYDEAVQHLRDLRAVAERESALLAFQARLHELRTAHAKKISFLSRLDRATLR